jgi:hypothetical protein
LYTTEFSYGTKYNEIENSDQKIRLRVVESPDSKGNQKVEGYYTTDTGLLVRLLGAGTFNPSMGEFKLERGVAADNEEGEFILTIEPYDKLYKAIFSTVSRPRFELTLERII